MWDRPVHVDFLAAYRWRSVMAFKFAAYFPVFVSWWDRRLHRPYLRCRYLRWLFIVFSSILIVLI